jgi:hypothetical protein
MVWKTKLGHFIFRNLPKLVISSTADTFEEPHLVAEKWSWKITRRLGLA